MQLPQATRDASLRAESFDVESHTIEIVWTTGAAVRRTDWWDGTEYDEALSLEPGAVRLDRLNAGAPFVDTHSTYCLDNVIGSVVPGSARIEDGKGVATILLSRAPGVADTVQKITEGVIRNISVGYWQHKIVKTEADDGTVARWEVVDWEPLEISAVPVPADAGSQVRSEQGKDGPQTRSCLIVTKAAIAPTPSPQKEPSMARKTAKIDDTEEKRLAALRAKREDESEKDEDKDERGDEADEESAAGEDDADEDKSDEARDGDDEDDKDERDADEDDDKDERSASTAAKREVQKALAAERTRVSEITDLAERSGLPKLGRSHVGKGTSVRKFRELVLERMLDKQTKRGAAAVAATAAPELNDQATPSRAASKSEREMEAGEAHWRRVAGKKPKAA